MTEERDSGTAGAAEVRVRVEYDAPCSHIERCDPEDFEDCASADEVLIRSRKANRAPQKPARSRLCAK